MQKEDNEEGELTLVLVRATEEETRQWQAAEAERKRDGIVKAAGTYPRGPRNSCESLRGATCVCHQAI